MEIIQRYDTILNYLINPNFFDIHQGFEKTYYTSANWILKENDVCRLKYNVFYYVTDKTKVDHFIKYESETQLHCIIKDNEIGEVAKEICAVKTEINLSTELFLKQNTLSFFKLLEFKPISKFPDEVEQEARRIKRLKGLLLFSEMTDEEKAIYKMNHNIK